MSSPTFRLAILRTLYALHYAGAGLWIPYLAPYLEGAGVSGAVQGRLFALRNIAYVFTQPALGLLADRIGILRVLKIAAVLAALTWVLVLRAGNATLELAAIFLLMSVGVSVFASLVDAGVIATLEGPGGDKAGGPRAFARSRIWGSVGFALAALIFGFAVSKTSPGTARTAILAVAVLQGLTAIVALAAPGARVRDTLRPPSLADAGRMLRDPVIARVLFAGTLHWITLAPYHTFFGAHIGHHGGGPMIIGLSIGVSVAVELVVMATAPRWLPRFSPRTVLTVSTLIGVVRWTLTAHGHPALILAAQALHGLSYGAFYLAMVDAVVSRTPPEHRATAQALVGSIALGGGTFLGNLVSGPLYDVDHGRTLFLAAAAFSVVSALASASIEPRARPS